MKFKETPETIKNELDGLVSHLPHFQKGDGYNVPEGYFESLPSRIQDRMSSSSHSESVGLSSVLLKRVVPVVAAVLLIAGLTIGLFFMERNGAVSFADISDADMEYAYLNMHGHIDHVLVYELVLESGMSAEEILYELEVGFLFPDSDEAYEEIIEMIFDNARYFGMESRNLLSSLD